MQRQEDKTSISRVHRSRTQARRSYDRLSRLYDLLAGGFEGRPRERTLDLLAIAEGETVLELGFGTGQGLKRIARAVGETGKAYGIDLSPGMLAVTHKRLARAGLLGRVSLQTGDALQTPFGDQQFDALFCSFTLELFDTPEIPQLLGEIKRVLKPHGRLAMVSLSKVDGNSLMTRLYEWAHRHFPNYADCRPIYLAHLLEDAGLRITHEERMKLYGLSCEVVVAEKP